jgi:uncharacterized protein
LKILLAPAETKNEGGNGTPFCKANFKYEALFDSKEYILSLYENYVNSLNEEALSDWFGLKNKNEVKKYTSCVRQKPTMKAIERYNGVAFEALNYAQLPQNAQSYIDNNVVIFSNLFGVLSASDLIPDYKYKQGAKLPKITVEKYYNEQISPFFEEYLGDEIIDLRAGFYEKFYQPRQANVLMLKFIKEGKVVSHWAKYYRGKVLQHIALHDIQSLAEFMALEIEGLKLIEIQEKKNTKLLILDIL